MIFRILFVGFLFSFYRNFVRLSGGNFIDHYPYITPDGYDWYSQGIMLTDALKNFRFAFQWPSLRPPIYVILNAIDYSLGGEGYFLGFIQVSAFLIIVISVRSILIKIVDCKVYTVPQSPIIEYLSGIVIAFPLFFISLYNLADLLCVALSLLSVNLFLYCYYKNNNNKMLFLWCVLPALVSGLTQTYGLLPLLIISLCFFIFKKISLSNYLTIVVPLVFFYLLTIYIWRQTIPHLGTPDNFVLLRFNKENIRFYINIFILFLLPLVLINLFFGFKDRSIINTSIINSFKILVVIFSALCLLYDWRESRFTFSFWTFFYIIAVVKIIPIDQYYSRVKLYLPMFLLFLCMLISPANFWQPTVSRVSMSPKDHWLYQFFTSNPIERHLEYCVTNCIASGYYNSLGNYEKRSIAYFSAILYNKKESCVFNGKVVQRPWHDGSIEDGLYFVSNCSRGWIANTDWLKKNQINHIYEISADSLSKIPNNLIVYK